MRLFLLSIGMVMAVAAAAWANCSVAPQGVKCGYDWNAAGRYPDEAKRFGAGSAVRVCMRGGVRTSGLFATPPVRGEAGVCYFWVRDMDAKVEANEFPKRRLFMQAAHGPCPRQDDAGYVENDGVSDGVFAALMARWNATGLPGDKGFAFPPRTKADETDGTPDFAAALATEKGRKRFTMSGVNGERFGPDSGFVSPTRAGAIGIVVSDSEHPSTTYYLIVDWVNGAFRIVDVDAIVSGC